MRLSWAVLAAAGLVLAVGGASHGGTVGRGDGPIRLHLGDKKGDYRAARDTGTLRDNKRLDATHRRLAPAAVQAPLDLTSVDYRVVRGGKEPALHIAWTVAGPLPFMGRQTGDIEASVIFKVALEHSPWSVSIEAAAGASVFDSHTPRVVACHIPWSAPTGGHVVRATVPLSCFSPLAPDKKFVLLTSTHGKPHPRDTAKLPTAVRLVASTEYATGSVIEHSDGSESYDITTVRDKARPTRTLDLTPLH
jgi:hypothetical protein